MNIGIPSALLAIASSACLAFSTACGIHTAPFRDAHGKRMPGSVATMTDEVIGGIEQRLWFRGIDVANLSTGKLIWAALQTDEANLIDLIKFGQGNRFSLEHLWNEFRGLDVDDQLTRFNTPIVFMLGRHDWEVPSVLAARYFERIQAPSKRLIWFEQSAHNPPLEEPERFNRAVVEALRSLVDSEQVSEYVPGTR